MDNDPELLKLLDLDDTNATDIDVSSSTSDDIITLDSSEDDVSDVNESVNDEVEQIILSADVIISRQKKKSLDEHFNNWFIVCDCDLDSETSIDRHFYNVDQGLHQLYNADDFDLLHDFEIGTWIYITLGDEIFMNQLTQLLDVDLDTDGNSYTRKQKKFYKFLKMLYVQTYNDIFGLPTGFIPLNMSVRADFSSGMEIFVLNNGINVPNNKSGGSLDNALIEFFTRKGITIDPLHVTVDLEKQFENYLIATLYKNVQIAFEKVYPDKKVLFVTDTGTKMNLNLIDADL